MQILKSTLFGGSALKRGIILAAFATLLASVGVVAAAITSVDLAPTPGDEQISLAFNTLIDDADTVVQNADVTVVLATGAAAGDSAPGVEVANPLGAVNNAQTRGNFAYSFEVVEAATASWDTSENIRIRIFSDDGTTSTLEATLYAQQGTKDDAAIEGIAVTIDLGSTTTIDDRYDIIVDRQ